MYDGRRIMTGDYSINTRNAGVTTLYYIYTTLLCKMEYIPYIYISNEIDQYLVKSNSIIYKHDSLVISSLLVVVVDDGNLVD